MLQLGFISRLAFFIIPDLASSEVRERVEGGREGERRWESAEREGGMEMRERGGETVRSREGGREREGLRMSA